jgi:putative endonuclease
MTNKGNTVIYTGVTNNVKSRACEHQEKRCSVFTRRCDINKLVYDEIFDNPENAIFREKQNKEDSRNKKIELIYSMNGECRDLYQWLWGIASPLSQ